MKILSAAEVRQADAYTIEHEPIASIDLMERAATAAYKWIERHCDFKKRFLVFCGTGNNGGDGLVIARLLHRAGCRAEAFALRFSDRSSDDFKINEERLRKSGMVLHDIRQEEDIPHIEDDAVVIDAMFGSGLSRPVQGIAANVIQHINATKAIVLAVDIPSGLFCESNADNDRNHIVQARHTLTFQVPKLSFFFPENAPYVGAWHVIPIGLDETFITSLPSKYYYLTEEMIAALLKKRKKFDHKGTYGHALIMAGSKGKMGAAVLCAAACLRSGTGLVSVQIPGCGESIMQVALPEAMLLPDPCEDCVSALTDTAPFSAIGTGPGLGQEEKTIALIKRLLQDADEPLVMDADALNILAKNKTWMAFLPPSSILTPHPKEFERLAGATSDHYERFRLQLRLAMKNGIYLVLKGAHTAIACPDGEVYFNSTGNSGMATAGSGDVLTGIITGLLAQGYDPKQASILGVYLHGFVGDAAADELGEEALLAGDMVKGIASGFKRLKKRQL